MCSGTDMYGRDVKWVAGMWWRGWGSRGNGKKPEHQGGGWRVPGESIRPVCTELPGPAENPDLLSCDWGFLWPFGEQMRDFHDLLRQKLASLFVLLGWTSIPIASLMMRPVCLGLWRGWWCGVAGCGTQVDTMLRHGWLDQPSTGSEVSPHN
jgi:hypothetical protein